MKNLKKKKQIKNARKPKCANEENETRGGQR